MNNQNIDPKKLPILIARKQEMDKLLNDNESIINDKIYVGALIQLQQTFFNLSKKIFFKTDNDFPLNGNTVKNKFTSPEKSLELSKFATLINFTTLKFENMFSSDSIFEASELLKLCSIADLSGNATYGNTTEELKEILWKIRNAMSHNNESLKNQGYYSCVNFTNQGNILIDTSIKGKGSVVIKTDVEKLHKFFCQIDRQKEEKKQEAVDKAWQLCKRKSDASVKAQLGDKIMILSADLNIPVSEYFKLNSPPVQEIKKWLRTKDNAKINEQIFDKHLKRRLKELYRTFGLELPYIFEESERGNLLQQIAVHCLQNSYPNTMLNLTLDLHEFTRCFDFSNSIEQNIFNFYNSSINSSQMVERVVYLRNDLYPSIVMNTAKFLFTNHEEELKEYLEKQKRENTDIYTSIPYRQSDLHKKLRNSIHHGRFLIEYPDKEIFKQNEIGVSFFDGEGATHNYIMTMPIKDIAKLVEDFGLYIYNGKQTQSEEEEEKV